MGFLRFTGLNLNSLAARLTAGVQRRGPMRAQITLRREGDAHGRILIHVYGKLNDHTAHFEFHEFAVLGVQILRVAR